MKFIEEPQLLALTNLLTDMKIGERVLTGRLEAFSCKRGGGEKKLCQQLDQHIKEMGASPQVYGTSPSLGALTDSSVRRLLIDLVCTMNASFPDYDFSDITPEMFAREGSVAAAVARVNAHLAEIGEVYHAATWLAHLWSCVEEAIRLKDCEVYSYVPDMQGGDPFSDGSLWSFNYFFVNRSLKRILYFTCVAKSRYRVMEETGGDGGDGCIDDDDDGDDADGGIFSADDSR
ncbi:unnamed protein product [Phaeothamnion confervicola]